MSDSTTRPERRDLVVQAWEEWGRMSGAERTVEVSGRLADTLMDVTGNLVGGDVDTSAVLELVADACADIAGATASGILMNHPAGGIHVVAVSEEQPRLLTVLEAQYADGPLLDCMRAGSVVGSSDVSTRGDSWPRFAAAAAAGGFRAAYAVPMRLAGRTVGGLNLLYAARTVLDGSRLRLCQVLADLAVLGFAQECDEARSERMFTQVLTMVNDRLHLGHAVGLVAGALDVDIETARTMIAGHARSNGFSIREVARTVTDGLLAPDDLARPLTES